MSMIRAITLDDVTKSDLESFYWLLSDSRDCIPWEKEPILTQWKELLNSQYSIMDATNRCTIVFKGLDYDFLCVIMKCAKKAPQSYGFSHISSKIIRGLGL